MAKHPLSEQRTLFLISAMVFISLVVTLNIWLGIRPPQIDYVSHTDTSNFTKVYMTQNSYDILSSRFKSDNKEFIYCMYGTEYDDGYVIDTLKETEVISSTNSTVTYKGCTKFTNYLGTIHSHPRVGRYPSSCTLSKQDIFTFGSDTTIFTGVICDIDEIAVYSSKDFDTSLDVNIVDK